MSARAAAPLQSEHPKVGRWGLGEASIAWLASYVVLNALYVGLFSIGGYSVTTPERPGGYLGRTVAHLANGEGPRHDSVPLIWRMVLLVPGWVVLLGVAWIVAGLARRSRPGWSLRGKPTDVVVGVLSGLFLQIPMMLIVGLVMRWVLGDFALSGRALALVDQVESPVALVMLVLAVGVGAPIVEELFYRGIVQRSLVENFGPVLGIGVASGIFGAVHGSVIEFAPLVVAGVGFGLLAHHWGRLLPAIIAHMTFNLFTLSVLLASAKAG